MANSCLCKKKGGGENLDYHSFSRKKCVQQYTFLLDKTRLSSPVGETGHYKLDIAIATGVQTSYNHITKVHSYIPLVGV